MVDAAFLGWCRRNGVWCHPGVRFPSEDGRGTYGVADCRFDAGTILMGLPKASMLTRLNAQEADALDALFEFGLPSVEVLGLAIALERKAGRHSMWHEYLESLAQDEPLPLLWTMQELKMLRGTGLDETSRRRKRRLVDNFRIAEAEWPSLSAATAFPSVQEYLAASTLSSSRAFRVDNQHGEGLLPLVDMLNHKASLVPSHGADGQSASGDSDEDDEQGKEGESTDDHLLCRDVTLRIPPGRGDGDSSDNDDEDEVDDDDEAYVVAVRDVVAGEEICHTYGELGNWDLLAGYGFTLSNNPFDTALLPWRSVEAAAGSLYGERVLRSRIRELRASGQWESPSTSLGHGILDTPFVFDRRGVCPAELKTLLYVLRLFDSKTAKVHKIARSRHEASALTWRMDDGSQKILLNAVQLHMNGYNNSISRELEAASAPKRQRVSAGTAMHGKQLHAARLVRGELSIWKAVCSQSNGASDLSESEIRAAEAGAAARKLRLVSDIAEQ